MGWLVVRIKLQRFLKMFDGSLNLPALGEITGQIVLGAPSGRILGNGVPPERFITGKQPGAFPSLKCQQAQQDNPASAESRLRGDQVGCPPPPAG